MEISATTYKHPTHPTSFNLGVLQGSVLGPLLFPQHGLSADRIICTQGLTSMLMKPRCQLSGWQKNLNVNMYPYNLVPGLLQQNLAWGFGVSKHSETKLSVSQTQASGEIYLQISARPPPQTHLRDISSTSSSHWQTHEACSSHKHESFSSVTCGLFNRNKSLSGHIGI